MGQYADLAPIAAVSVGPIFATVVERRYMTGDSICQNVGDIGFSTSSSTCCVLDKVARAPTRSFACWPDYRGNVKAFCSFAFGSFCRTPSPSKPVNISGDTVGCQVSEDALFWQPATPKALLKTATQFICSVHTRSLGRFYLCEQRLR
jgi:hypothetical protein